MTDERHHHPGLPRILDALGVEGLVELLANRLTAADLTTLLMAVAGERAMRADPTDVLTRYERDRFTRPSPTAFVQLRDVEDAFVTAVPDEWGWVIPSPVVPFATHAALGGVSQDWVLTTLRPTEAAADPTAALALEAAARRKDPRARQTETPTRLAAIQRITRAQRYESAEALVHFTIMGLVTAGRGEADEGFDIPALLEHLSIYVAALIALDAGRIDVFISARADRYSEALADGLAERFGSSAEIRVTDDDERMPSQRYYTRACFKVHTWHEGSMFEVADGGFTDWTERMLSDRRERLLISGVGLDRLTRLTGTGR